MIVIICAMSEERDAFISLMNDVKIVKLENINYHGMAFDNKCYKGKLSGKDVVIVHSGVGKVYAAIVTSLAIKKFKPELVVNVGCAGSLNKNIHVGDVVVATRVADWDVDVPGWERSIYSDKMSFACDGRFSKLIKSIKTKTNVKSGFIVSSDEFIYKKSQVNTIKKYFPDALCGEMEGSSVANTCYAFGVNSAIIRSISDETLVSGNYKKFDFNLKQACDNAADICAKIIKRY
ncbi:MAG: 5'-methylthioadenosine/adenosylhomocysteine nucleosidase [Erysipelotrichaceae bacterium]|nr:5'-methylthioadenosine/adenosylhomocysteine nucleosidase [Erysipelotrichaceae bacterium]